MSRKLLQRNMLRGLRSEQLPPSASPAQVVTKAEVLRRLELDIRHRLDGMLAGDYRTTAIGPGNERAGARRYEPGDDARRIDWSLTARALDTHVRTTEADRELETWVIADRSASLDFGTADREKREVVLAVTAAFGILSVRAANRFGVLIAGDGELRQRPAASGRTALLSALACVYDTQRQAQGLVEGNDLAAAMTRLRRTTPRRGQIIVASDFLDRSNWQKPLRMLALHHNVIAVHVTDPRELTLPEVGMLSLVDPETGRELHIQTRSADLRRKYADAAAQRHTQIGNDIRSAHAEYLHLSTDRDWVLDVISFVTGRRGRLRAGVTASASHRDSGLTPTAVGSSS